MNWLTRILTLLVLAPLVLAGCGKVDKFEVEVSTDPVKAAAQIEKAFQGADPTVKAAATGLAAAFKTKDYEAAIMHLTMLRRMPENTEQQTLVLSGAMRSLQQQLAEGAGKGDPKAVKASEVLKGSRF